MASGKITISEVAREAGVSIATVSRVMQGRTTVSPELAQRVQEVARHLGYRPSPVARSLATGSTGMVGILVPQLSNPYFHELIKAIGTGAGQDGFRTLVLESDDRPSDEAELAAELYAHSDGVILCSPRMPDADLLLLAESRPRLLCVNRMPPEGRVAGVAYDPYPPMLQICRHLADLGHRRVAFLTGSLQSWVNSERWRAAQHGVSFGLEPIRVPAGSGIEDGYAAVDAALAHSPTALIGANDLCAVGALSRLHELGLLVPQDISIAGFDDIPLSRFSLPPLTTARTRRTDLSEQAWVLMRAILAGEAPPNQMLTGSELLVRASTGPAPGTPVPPAGAPA